MINDVTVWPLWPPLSVAWSAVDIFCVLCWKLSERLKTDWTSRVERLSDTENLIDSPALWVTLVQPLQTQKKCVFNKFSVAKLCLSPPWRLTMTRSLRTVRPSTMCGTVCYSCSRTTPSHLFQCSAWTTQSCSLRPCLATSLLTSTPRCSRISQVRLLRIPTTRSCPHGWPNTSWSVSYPSSTWKSQTRTLHSGAPLPRGRLHICVGSHAPGRSSRCYCWTGFLAASLPWDGNSRSISQPVLKCFTNWLNFFRSPRGGLTSSMVAVCAFVNLRMESVQPCTSIVCNVEESYRIPSPISRLLSSLFVVARCVHELHVPMSWPQVPDSWTVNDFQVLSTTISYHRVLTTASDHQRLLSTIHDRQLTANWWRLTADD